MLARSVFWVFSTYRFKFRPRLLGEASVYDLLARIDDEKAFAVHSVNVPEHVYKRWGRADLVVVSRTGLLLLEVHIGFQHGFNPGFLRQSTQQVDVPQTGAKGETHRTTRDRVVHCG